MSMRAPTAHGVPPWGRRVVTLARVSMLVLCAAAALVSRSLGELLVPLLGLLALAAIMSLPLRPAWSSASPIVEGALAGALIGSVPLLPEPLLPYLVVPSLAAGLLRGAVPALLASAATAVALVAVRALNEDMSTTGSNWAAVVQWVGLSLAVGLVGAWGRWSTIRAVQGRDYYREANRLLVQLRDVARTLPAGLDEVGIAAGELDRLVAQFGLRQGIVSGLTDNGRLAPLASTGAQRAMWGAGEPDREWAAAIDHREVQVRSGQLDGKAGFTALAALRLGDQPLGVVAGSRTAPDFSEEERAALQERADDLALRLDTARLFSEVRAWAAVEERRRLSREIHDGIAQELTGIGFALDDVSRSTQDESARASLQDVRAELTRTISELRLSIFDLRSQVEPTTGLGTALGDYVRQVGTMSGLTVHLELDEDVRRLGVETEAELLRIAQEAITNARRHARARHLWVTLRSRPPDAYLRVADDGCGIGPAPRDRYGLEIMQERAARIGAALTIGDAPVGGTVVEVRLGGSEWGSHGGSEGRTSAP